MMAEQVKSRRHTAANKVKKLSTDLIKLLENATDRSPTEVMLQRKVDACQAAFDLYEETHSDYLKVAKLGEEELNTADDEYNQLYDDFDAGIGPAQDRLHLMKVPPEVDISVEDRIKDLTNDANHQAELVRVLFEKIESSLADKEVVSSVNFLDQQVDMLTTYIKWGIFECSPP